LLRRGRVYGDLSLLYAPRSCQNVEVSGLQVEVVLWLCAHFVSGKEKNNTIFCPMTCKSLATRDHWL